MKDESKLEKGKENKEIGISPKPMGTDLESVFPTGQADGRPAYRP